LLIQALARLGVTPNTLTVIGLLLSIVTALVIAQGFLVAGGVLVLFAGIFDMLDGAMARVRNAATTFGAFFDSALDRYSEGIILLGVLVYVLQHPGLHDVLWPAANEQSWMIAFIYIAVVGSLMVSYAKARADGLGLECKSGLLARPERVVILTIGLLSGTGICIWMLALLAVFSHVTAVERILTIWHITRQPGKNSVTREHVPMNEYDTSENHCHVTTTIGTCDTKDAAARPVPTSVPPFTGDVHHQ
jgi:CDP-diacylglycerol--glycerol-3-phosphate 3-phosphatidyltransferase